MKLPILNLPDHNRSEIWVFSKTEISSFDESILGQVRKWRFLHAGKPVHIVKPNGKTIHYEGLKFTGSVKLVFWNDFIAEFLKEGIPKTLRSVKSKAIETDTSINQALDETEALLKLVVSRVFTEMVHTDSILSGDGFVKGPERDVTGNIQQFHRFVYEHKKLIEKERNPDRNSVDEIIELKPNIWGLGIDLRALIRKWNKRK